MFGVGVGVGGNIPPTVSTAPSMPKAGMGRPPGVLACGLLTNSGCAPSGAKILMSTVQVYSVAPSGIGSKFANESTRARTPKQSMPTVQPLGMKANSVTFLSIAGLPAHDTIGVVGSKKMSFWVADTFRPSSARWRRTTPVCRPFRNESERNRYRYGGWRTRRMGTAAVVGVADCRLGLVDRDRTVTAEIGQWDKGGITVFKGYSLR